VNTKAKDYSLHSGERYPSLDSNLIGADHLARYEYIANIYKNFARTVRKQMNGETPNEFDLDFPTIDDGIRGMQFVETVIASGKSSSKWVKMKS
jgi:hypothetical protein